ncbi:MAG: hypothetical protein J5640_07490 [Bacteroidales bacterium]|nr:hypothetical protein [Bacteroidales bacterium]
MNIKKVLLIIAILLMTPLTNSCSLWSKAPKGKLIYCSYAANGAAGLGKDYCELIADPGVTPRVVVVLDRDCHFAEERRQEFEVDSTVVNDLQKQLESIKVWKLDGYNLEEPICGGHAHRIYMEYDSGEKIDARWYGHGVKDEAIRAYNLIEYFFKPWRDQMPPEKRR